MTNLTPDPATLARFNADLDSLVPAETRLGIAVSGGPDSLALLLLAAAARPGMVEAATVDHGLRHEAQKEAAFVADICARLALPHHILHARVAPGASLQAQARLARYRVLGAWGIECDLGAIASGHHADDQAETLLMRLARGAGLSGLAATRRRRVLEPGVVLVRPLLDWRRTDLRAIVAAADLTPVDDPTNRDPRHDRTRFRGLLADADWADAERLASSARWLADADEAIEWAIDGLIPSRLAQDDAGVSIDPDGLPRELQRRLLLAAFDRLAATRPRGPDLDRALSALAAGRTVTLSGLKLGGGPHWRLAREARRRR
ncbi:MAG: tRNA lysidine(34) synthetase TilS [Pseudomonadota bacterium]